MNYPFATVFFCWASCFGAAVYQVKEVPTKKIHVPAGYDKIKELIATYQSVVSQKPRLLTGPTATHYLVMRLALIKAADEYFREMKIRLLKDYDFKAIYDEYQQVRKHHEVFFNDVWQLLKDHEVVAIKLYIFCQHYQVLTQSSPLDIYRILDDALGGNVLGASKYMIVDISCKGLPILEDSRRFTVKACDLYDRPNVDNLLDDMLWLREVR